MRNSSDIFCLKELKDGDTNGTQLFSVNGQCQLPKVSRRRNLHNGSASFEYGSSIDQNLTHLADEHRFVEEKDDHLQIMEKDLNELYETEDGPDSSESLDAVYDELTRGAPCGLSPTKKKELSAKYSTRSSPDGKKQHFRKLNTAKEDSRPTESAMSRNPLTGAGIEIETHRKPKKGPARLSNWAGSGIGM
ncbi:hypothetical protein D910_11029 [Dendroctonus ponderosae]